MTPAPLLLASSSPRRKDLLALLRIPFEVVEPEFSETPRPGVAPRDLAAHFADGKAWSCASRRPDRLVLGSDTLIELEDRVLGKPADLEEARRMLEQLSGREHLIHTGVALRRQQDARSEVAVETVKVRMAAFGAADIAAYLQTGESLGKAGAYSIQGEGSRFIEAIEGDYTAAVGLPLKRTAELLAACGWQVPVDLGDLYRRKPYPNWGKYA